MKRLPIFAVAIAYVAVVLIWVGTDRRVTRETFEKFSAANTSGEGLSLALKYLARTGHRKVNMLTTPPDTELPRHAVVLRTVAGNAFSLLDFFGGGDHEKEQPTLKKQKKKKRKEEVPVLTADEEDFVRNGGRFVLSIGGRYEMLDTRSVVGQQPAVRVFPIWPGLSKIELPESRTLAGTSSLRRMHALYVVGTQPAIVRMPVGKGELIVTAAPELLDNEHVAHHLDFLTALAGDGRPVYFDETVHGLLSGTGTFDLLRRWRLGPMLVLLAILAAMTIWRGARRVGPAEEDFRDTRSDAVDLVGSLGALYARTTSNAQAITLYHQALTQSVAAQTGLRGDALKKRVHSLTNEMRVPPKDERMDPATFKTSLETLNESFRRLEHAEHR
jgi:hypothetical protein